MDIPKIPNIRPTVFTPPEINKNIKGLISQHELQIEIQKSQSKENSRYFIINLIFAIVNIAMAAGNIYLIVKDDSRELLKQSIELQTKQFEKIESIEKTLGGTISVKIDSAIVVKK